MAESQTKNARKRLPETRKAVKREAVEWGGDDDWLHHAIDDDIIVVDEMQPPPNKKPRLATTATTTTDESAIEGVGKAMTSRKLPSDKATRKKRCVAFSKRNP